MYFGFAIMGASLRKRIGLTTGYVDYYNTTPKEGRRRKSMNRRDVDRTLFEHIDALAAELPAQVQEHLLTCDRLPGFLYRLFTCQSMTTRLRRRSFVIQSPRFAFMFSHAFFQCQQGIVLSNGLAARLSVSGNCRPTKE